MVFDMDTEQNSEYNFKICRFLADQSDNGVSQDNKVEKQSALLANCGKYGRFLSDNSVSEDDEVEEQPVLFRNCSVRGKRIPPFRSLSLPVKAMAKQSCEKANVPKGRTERPVSSASGMRSKHFLNFCKYLVWGYLI